MLHRPAHFGLALQTLIELGGFAFVVKLLLDLDGLQRHAAADAFVAGKVDHSHGPFAKDRLNFVLAELASCLGGGCNVGHCAALNPNRRGRGAA